MQSHPDPNQHEELSIAAKAIAIVAVGIGALSLIPGLLLAFILGSVLFACVSFLWQVLHILLS